MTRKRRSNYNDGHSLKMTWICFLRYRVRQGDILARALLGMLARSPTEYHDATVAGTRRAIDRLLRLRLVDRIRHAHLNDMVNSLAPLYETRTGAIGIDTASNDWISLDYTDNRGHVRRTHF